VFVFVQYEYHTQGIRSLKANMFLMIKSPETVDRANNKHQNAEFSKQII